MVRDPRAMLYSMHKMKQSFFRFKEHPEILCEFMHEDLKMETELSPSRYIYFKVITKLKYSINV